MHVCDFCKIPYFYIVGHIYSYENIFRSLRIGKLKR